MWDLGLSNKLNLVLVLQMVIYKLLSPGQGKTKRRIWVQVVYVRSDSSKDWEGERKN